ncbi:uncharacterized protein ISCGN_025161 [Ixodes scapularis]
MVKIAVPPDASWKRFAVAMKGLFGMDNIIMWYGARKLTLRMLVLSATYEQARRKLERSQYTSELSSDSESPQRKRMRRPPPQWSQSDEEPVRHKPTKAAPRKVPAVLADFPQGLFTAASKEGSSSAGRQSSSHSQAPSDSSENCSILGTVGLRGLAALPTLEHCHQQGAEC